MSKLTDCTLSDVGVEQESQEQKHAFLTIWQGRGRGLLSAAGSGLLEPLAYMHVYPAIRYGI